MCEVTRQNFTEKLPEIKRSFEKAKFLSLDLEFSALQPLQCAPSLFDTNKERYSKLRRNLEQVIPVQVGITAFHFDGDNNSYFGDVFLFYTAPSALGFFDKSFYFQASTLQFLCMYNFDFNKFAYSSVPYLNKLEESQMRQMLKQDAIFGENGNFRQEFDHVIGEILPVVSKWYKKDINSAGILELQDLCKQYGGCREIVYCVHKHLRGRFKNIWTYQENNLFYLKKIKPEELEMLQKACTLDEDLVDCLLGFSHVFKLMTSLKKPIVGHNLMQDLMIMINCFETPLPKLYSQYKRLTNELFPTIFDTKTLYYELRKTIPKEKDCEATGLEGLFNYFKNGVGRHLVVNPVAIESNVGPAKLNKYHQADWDSFCTGYIFLRLGYYKIYQDYPKRRQFVSSEVISGLSQYKNCVNMIRGSSSFLRIDGDDPISTRPPWLIVESKKGEPIDVGQLASLLSSSGFVDIKKFSSCGNRLLLAVDNFRTARLVSNIVKNHSKIQIKQYSVLRHSPVLRTLLLTALTLSSTMLLWLTHKVHSR